MSLSRKIAAAVEELGRTGATHTPRAPARWRDDPLVVEGPGRTGATQTPVAVAEGPHRLTLAVDLATPVAVSCSGLEFATTDRAEWSLDALKSWAARLAARVTYLLEPLDVHEVDAAGRDVLLRSKAPSRRDGSRTYYELRLDARGALQLARFRYDEASRRRHPVPCQLTIETLERLADDLVASVS